MLTLSFKCVSLFTFLQNNVFVHQNALASLFFQQRVCARQCVSLFLFLQHCIRAPECLSPLFSTTMCWCTRTCWPIVLYKYVFLHQNTLAYCWFYNNAFVHRNALAYCLVQHCFRAPECLGLLFSTTMCS